MKVILNQDVPKLGKEGSVVKVKDGYARNFLLPRELAFIATDANLKRVETLKVKRAAADEENRKEAQNLANQLSKVSCTITVEVNDRDKMYGAVTETEIVRALENEGISLDKRAIVLEAPISELGIFEVGVQLHKDVTAKLRVWVAKK